MFTSMILVCQLQVCSLVFSDLFYETEEDCQVSQATEGIYYLIQNYPETDFIEFYCHKWTGPKEGTPT